MKHRILEELRNVLILLCMIWLVYLISIVVPSVRDYGVVPRTVDGLLGIPTMPFLHSSLAHIVSNTIPLFVLLLLLGGSRANSWMIVCGIVLFNGILLWIVGRKANHIGASGLVFGLITFLIASGILEKRPGSLLVTVVVGILFGGTLLGGIHPFTDQRVSWEGHLCGAIGGVLMAYTLVKHGTANGAIANW